VAIRQSLPAAVAAPAPAPHTGPSLPALETFLLPGEPPHQVIQSANVGSPAQQRHCSAAGVLPRPFQNAAVVVCEAKSDAVPCFSLGGARHARLVRSPLERYAVVPLASTRPAWEVGGVTFDAPCKTSLLAAGSASNNAHCITLRVEG
jgi:hypothetical protein